jgi:hypothetical protein
VVCFLESISDISEVSTHSEHVHLLFKFSFLCRIFQFSRLSVASLLCEWRWAIRLSTAIIAAPDSIKALNLS